MCIAFLTTAHPDYALIILDNRDEFILRPTSRPHWWTHDSGATVLSARDLQREEKGTWMGVSREGRFAILTSYLESETNSSKPIYGKLSRGAMVTEWLGSGIKESTADSVHRFINECGVQDAGGFSMIAGHLKPKNPKDPDRSLEPIAVISNRCDHVDDVPWISGERGQVYGLSNTLYDDPHTWPNVESGKELIKGVIDEAIARDLSQEELVEKLFSVLDTDTLPKDENMTLAEYVAILKHSIFIPALGDEIHRKAMQEAREKGRATFAEHGEEEAIKAHLENNKGEPKHWFDKGMFGTQRQTVILVDWDGNVFYRERALWDANGNPLERGKGDEFFNFKIEGWE